MLIAASSRAESLPPDTKTLERISVTVEPGLLNPVRQTNAEGRLILTGYYSDDWKSVFRCWTAACA